MPAGSLCCASLILLLTASAAAQVSVVPTDVQMPGTQPGELLEELDMPDSCEACHGGYDPAVEPYRNWSGSMMAHAGRDPIFWATVAVAEQDFGGAGDLCLRCHLPKAWLAGRSTPTDGSSATIDDAGGISCDLCHRLTNPDMSEWLGVQNTPFLAHDEGLPPTGYQGSGEYVVAEFDLPKLGPYDDAVALHNAAQSDYTRDSAMCGTCHDVSNPVIGDLAPNNGAQTPLDPLTFSGTPGTAVEGKAAFNNFPYQYGVGERTFSEHQASAFATLLVSDYPTLPPELQAGDIKESYEAAIAASPDGNYVDGTERTYSCQTCHMPPVTGRGCEFDFAPIRTDLPLHDLVGGNYWMPDVIAYLEGLDKLVLGGGMNPIQLAAMDEGADRARHHLETAASLSVAGDSVTVVNLTGHKLISGYPEGRRMWLNIRWYSIQGLLVREDGAYGELNVDIDGQPVVVETILDLSGTNTRIYEAHHGLSQEWAAKLLGLGYSPGLPLAFDRVTGALETTLGDAAAGAPGSAAETFHFVLNDSMVSDNRIPPYGMRYDDAVPRNILPVPAEQYGDPGPGETFDHFDVVDLNPPGLAVSATIDLLYQPTSWEYIQFLDLANDGSVVFLALTGTDLRDAWLATDMAEPHVMASTVWTANPTDAWTDHGNSMAGTKGVPSLVGAGTLLPAGTLSLTLSGALQDTGTTLVIGLSELSAPVEGGVLVPNPDVLISGLATGPHGTVVLGGRWPMGVPSGTTFYFQHWINDPGGPFGWAASNGVSGTTP